MNFGGGARNEIAVHESGHAVARILSIGRAGITQDNAVRWIEISQGTPHCSVFELPLNMPGLKEYGEREGIVEGKWPTVEQWRKLFSFMGIDPMEWASVRLLEITAGGAAQAQLTGGPFDYFWQHPGCSDDRQKVNETCQRVGLSGPEAAALFAKQSQEACAVMAKIDVWRAVERG